MSTATLSYEQQRACAAHWMYERRDRVGWWRWSVLTDHNSTDPEALRLPHRTAFLIFSDMVQRGLLVPVIADDGGDAFTINPGRDAEWQELMHPRFNLFKGHGLTVLGWILSAVVGGVVTKLLGL
jgi:hypothetical protein